ncbi:hypothetical protein GCM10011340_33570 [Roseivirga thermotolerans]|uniref:DUF5916 domain-containing protein n=2 Tax=Roseivirga thermotolerans TaxID=1758176 RepID=A0ABQ3IBU7_9BACT|nr:hypothetical protein GCM10011340_33570 [Roseivirga thermotolerans]
MLLPDMKRSILLLLLLTSLNFGVAQVQPKSFNAVRTTEKIKIDGVFDEASWQEAPVLTDFVQRRPNPGAPSQRKTEVRLMYDDEAVYIAAKIYEDRDQVFNILTNRDNIGNSDYFGVAIDPFKAGLNGVGLFVTVAGVQYDALYSNGGNERIWRNDNDWNAVWLSDTKINDDHWTAEFKIPYAVLRFNSREVQEWGINFFRKSTALNEDSFWNPIDPQIDGFLNQAGVVKNLRNIETPTRLFFYPYVSTVVSRSTATGFVEPQFNGGMDIKYGINDAFTLDATLIPDFSGVRSDNQVLNLSPFEVRFDENRQFFTEGVELFNKAGLFYSRRIGSTFGNLTEELNDNETIIVRPQAAQLINASKITGRTNSGLGIGFFNALTERTFITVQDTETGAVREIEADPLTNFNVIVLDQNLKNNSSLTLTNTNVLRGKNADDANVTGLNFNLNDESLTWRVRGFYAYSQIASHNIENNNIDRKTGYKYNIGFSKTRGNFQFGVNRNVETDDYDINDLGFLRRANRIDHELNLSYLQFEPKGIFNDYRYGVRLEHNKLYNPNMFSEFQVSANFGGSFRNFWGFSVDANTNPVESNDYFEARVPGYIFKRPESYSFGARLNTDSRKNFRLSGRLRFWKRPDWDQVDNSANIGARLRMGTRVEINHNVDYSFRENERGYVRRIYDNSGALEHVVFGIRNVRNLTNTLSSSYIFTNRMGITFRMRHYWSRVEYNDFLELTEDDRLQDIDYTGTDSTTGEPLHNRNFNQFNIDMEYNWQFLPGSEVRVIWKRSIGTDDLNTQLDFFDNFGNTLSAPNFDTITIRMVYFVDYLKIKNIFRKS